MINSKRNSIYFEIDEFIASFGHQNFRNTLNASNFSQKIIHPYLNMNFYNTDFWKICNSDFHLWLDNWFKMLLIFFFFTQIKMPNIKTITISNFYVSQIKIFFDYPSSNMYILCPQYLIICLLLYVLFKSLFLLFYNSKRIIYSTFLV